MVITKREDVTKQVFCKLPLLKKTLSSGKSLYISTYSVSISILLSPKRVGVGAYYLFLPLGWVLIRGGR